MIHPDLGILIRYRDGELSGRLQGSVKAHVSQCERCRWELDRFESALFEIREQAATPSQSKPLNPDLLNGIRGAIRKWEAEKTRPEHSAEALKQRVAREIEPYLGPQASRKVLQSVSSDGQNLLNTVERILCNFLGEQAASDLVSHVVNSAIIPK